MRITLWVLQIALALLLFIMVGYSHALAPFDQVAQQATWMQHVPRALSLFIGYAEGGRSGAFVISKAGGDPALAAQCLDHLKQYLTLLFSRQFGAP